MTPSPTVILSCSTAAHHRARSMATAPTPGTHRPDDGRRRRRPPQAAAIGDWSHASLRPAHAVLRSRAGFRLGPSIILGRRRARWSVVHHAAARRLRRPSKIAGTLLQTTPILICGIAACIGLRGGAVQCRHRGPALHGRLAPPRSGFAFAAADRRCVRWPAGCGGRRRRGRVAIRPGLLPRPLQHPTRWSRAILVQLRRPSLCHHLTIFLFKRPAAGRKRRPSLPAPLLPELFSFSRLKLGLHHRLSCWRSPRRLSSATARTAMPCRRARRRNSPNMAASTIASGGFRCCSSPAPSAACRRHRDARRASSLHGGLRARLRLRRRHRGAARQWLADRHHRHRAVLRRAARAARCCSKSTRPPRARSSR